MSVTSLSGPLGGAIPQMRTRSVSLRIGPFGLTYATDQVLWRAPAPESVSRALSGQAEPGPVSPAAPSGDATTAVPPEVAVQQGRQQSPHQAGQPSRAFAQDLSDARVQAELARQARRTRPASETETREAQGDGGAAAQSGQQRSASGSGSNPGGNIGDPALRRAIGAYLSCASCLSRPAPMLQAVA